MAKTDAAAKHSIFIEDRCKTTLTGVIEVIAFSDSEVTLKTSRGALLVRGKGLSISKLNTDTGELFISGEIALLRYSKDKNSSGILEGLFK